LNFVPEFKHYPLSYLIFQKEYGGKKEIAAMSKIYNRDFIVYQNPDEPGINVTQNGYIDTVSVKFF
jgi:hypothetical protein